MTQSTASVRSNATVIMNYWTVGKGKFKIDAILLSLNPSDASEQLIMSEVMRVIQEKQTYEV